MGLQVGRPLAMTGAPLAIDLFCGLGGWSDGLLAEGYRVVGFDIERHVYGDHAYPAQLVLQDVLTIHGRQFKDAALIVASPPCQEYSYMAMPWTKAKQKIRDYETGVRDVKQLTALFDACFRIKREACEAAGRHIPLVVENVRGAQRWVGRAAWHFGSFYLWGDVPALMPIAMKFKNPGFRFDGSGGSFQTESVRRELPEGVKAGDRNKARASGGHQWTTDFAEAGTKNTGGSWFNVGSPGQKETGRNPVHELAGVKMSGEGSERTSKGRSAALGNYDQLREQMELGIKGFTPHGQPLGKNELGRKHGSRSKARKAASALIAKIPYTLSRHIAEAWKPVRAVSA